MSLRRLTVLTLAVGLVAVVLLAGISYWSDSMAGESGSSYAADAAALAGKIDPTLIARGEYLAKLGDCGDRKSVV